MTLNNWMRIGISQIMLEFAYVIVSSNLNNFNNIQSMKDSVKFLNCR